MRNPWCEMFQAFAPASPNATRSPARRARSAARGPGSGSGRVTPPRVYDRSRVTVVSALYPGSGRSRALTRALITAWSQQGDRQP